MVTKAKKALLASLAAFLCVMLTVFGLSMSVSLSETAKAADETTTEVAEVNGVKFATLAEAIAAAKDGETVKLLADATEDVVVNKNITLDLGKWTITGTNKSNAYSHNGETIVSLIVAKGANATVKNGNIKGTAAGYTIQNNGTATFEDITATAGNNGSSMIDNWGTLTINSGVYFGGLNVVKSEEDSKLTINGGKFTLAHSEDGYTGVIFAYGDTTITGGEFIQSLTTCGRWDHPQVVATGVVEGHAAITKVTGGTFTNNYKDTSSNIFRGVGKGTSDNFAVSGGTFNKSVPDSYFADGFIPTRNADGTYGVKEGKYVAKVGSKKYETLADAIRLAAKGKTVTLLDNISGNFEIASAKNITLDLNGFTLNGGMGPAKAAITNKGTLTITDSSAAKTGTIKRDDNGVENETSYYVIRNRGTMTIEQANVVNNSGYRKTNPSGSMIGSSLICNGDNDEGASLTINGGKLTQLNFIAIKNGANGTLVVNGGEITSNHSAIQNWFNAELTGGTIRGQLWTDAWKEGESVGNTVIGRNVDYEGEIVMDVTGSTKPKLTINGGNLSVTNWIITTACAELGGKPTVSGGTFSSEVNKDYLADGFVINQNENKTYGVREGSGFAGANVVVTESLAMKVTIANGTASKYVVVTYKGLDGVDKSVKLDTLTDGCYLFDKIMPQMIDVKFSFELYDKNDVMLDRKANYSVVDYLADIIKRGKDSAEFRNVAASLIEYANRARAVKGLTTIVAPTFVDEAGNAVTLDYNAFVDAHKIPAKDTLGAISEGDGKVIYKARVVFDDAYTLKFYANAGDGKYTYKLSKNGSTEDITFDENGEFTINVLAQDITTQYVIKVYGEDKTKPVQTVTYGVSTYCIRMQETKTPQGELYVASYYYGVAVQQYGAANAASVK